ncbi:MULTISPECIES: helix-turn-helix domain-containing protein [unclassified Methylobacterium]|uniref:helix-turn-helix domain-containing protein n=1 Tax=unclassified Methylobacterium TaxID=2615210 RepID=UPI0011C1D432|nr:MULTISPECIES: helix-turn-helix domain-containing protein [unclassified Methylobacterium]QEE38828.1 hypothetical protein FVA80_07480 [Methylobacterium sp. WL1]TXN53616.1 hypothetical protein FV241_27455 [Methylobacterium sp. WL2]
MKDDRSIMTNIRWAGRQRIANVPAKNVLNAIATYANREGLAHPSQRELANQTGYSERAVRMALAFLAGANPASEKFIERRERRRGNGSRTSDELKLLIGGRPDTRQEVPVVSADEAPNTGTTCQTPRNLMPTSPAPDSGPTSFEQPEEQPKEHSEPDGSGTRRPEPGAKALLFSEGRPSLMALGLSEREAGTMIGRWLRDSGDDADRVLDAIRRACDAAPHDPRPWITAALKNGSPEDAHHGAGSSSYRRAAAAGAGSRSSDVSRIAAVMARVADRRGITFGTPQDRPGRHGPPDRGGTHAPTVLDAHWSDAGGPGPAHCGT